MRQHTEGPTHRKALARANAQREREQRLGAYASTAQEAVVRSPALRTALLGNIKPILLVSS